MSWFGQKSAHKRDISISPEQQQGKRIKRVDQKDSEMATKVINSFTDLVEYLDTGYLVKVENLLTPVKAEIAEIQVAVGHIQRELEFLKREVNSKKLKIIGLDETKNETHTQLMEAVKDFIVDKLKVTENIVIDEARRMGRPTDGRTRPILISLERRTDKFTLFKSTKNLKGTNMYLNQLLTSFEMTVEKKLRDKGKAMKAGNKDLRFFIRNGNLNVDDQGHKSKFVVNANGDVKETGRGRMQTN